VAKKASQAVSQKNRQEVTTAATSRTKITNSDETVATIRNINQGRSLNLMFYRLYNRYSGGLFLDDLRFDVLPGFEMIAGSGVYESRNYGTKELPQVIEEFKRAGLHWSEEEQEKYADILLESIESLLQDEYWGPADEEPKPLTRMAFAATLLEFGAAESGVPATSVGALTFPLPTPNKSLLMLTAKSGGETEQAESVLERKPLLSRMDRLVRLTLHSDKPMVPENLLVAASGFYLDAVVGALPSTEPYSEAMRTEEIRMRQAEVFLKASEGLYNEARAAQLRTAGITNVVTGLLPSSAEKHIAVSVRAPLSAGQWAVLFDGEEKGTSQAIDTTRHIAEFSWTHAQPWLADKDALLSKVTLLNKSSGETIGCESKSETPLAGFQRESPQQPQVLS
jgi:hypothetical protein